MRTNKQNAKEKVKEKYGGEYELLDDYINQETEFTLKHLKCNHTYKVKPHTFFRNNNNGRCPFCYDTKNTTKEQFIFKLNKIKNNEYILIGEFENMTTKVKLKHKICQKEFEVNPVYFLKRTNCPFCSHQSYKYESEYVKKEINELTDGEYTVLGEYKNEHTPFLIRHNKCGNTYNVRRRNFIYNNTRCPYCYSMSNRSKGEEIICNYLDYNNIEYDTQFKIKGCVSKNQRLLTFDFYIQKFNLLIEYDGEQHFFLRRDQLNKLNIQKENDQIKNEFLKNQNYNFIRLHYKLNKNEIEYILNEYIKNNGYLSSTTIEKYNLLVYINKNEYNFKEYYTNLNEDYFE